MNSFLDSPTMRHMETASERRSVAAFAALTAGGIALGIPAFYATEAMNTAHVTDQLQTSQGVAANLLNDYDQATSTLPTTCQSVIKAAMKGTLDNPSAITAAANSESSCKTSMNKITTLTYEYHDKLVPVENSIGNLKASIATNTMGDAVALGFGALASISGGLLGAVAGFRHAIRKTWTWERIKSELAQKSVTTDSPTPELTTSGSIKNPASARYSSSYPEDEYVLQNDMK